MAPAPVLDLTTLSEMILIGQKPGRKFGSIFSGGGGLGGGQGGGRVCPTHPHPHPCPTPTPSGAEL